MNPPLVIGIETATEVCGVALADRDGLRAEAVISSGLSHSSRLMELVRRVTSDLSVEVADLDALAVSIGPGSFTGIRIGMGAALGIAAGAGLQIVPVPTLDAFAWGHSPFDGVICPFVDARREEVYFCLYEGAGNGLRRIADYAVLPPGRMLAELVNTLDQLGGGRKALLAGPLAILGAKGVNAPGKDRVLTAPAGRSRPHPGPVARMGVDLYLRGGCVSPGSVEPLYVRRSDAEVRRSRE